MVSYSKIQSIKFPKKHEEGEEAKLNEPLISQLHMVARPSGDAITLMSSLSV